MHEAMNTSRWNVAEEGEMFCKDIDGEVMFQSMDWIWKVALAADDDIFPFVFLNLCERQMEFAWAIWTEGSREVTPAGNVEFFEGLFPTWQNLS